MQRMRSHLILVEKCTGMEFRAQAPALSGLSKNQRFGKAVLLRPNKGVNSDRRILPRQQNTTCIFNIPLAWLCCHFKLLFQVPSPKAQTQAPIIMRGAAPASPPQPWRKGSAAKTRQQFLRRLAIRFSYIWGFVVGPKPILSAAKQGAPSCYI